MGSERISLRLEKEDLDLIDNYVQENLEISNRSQLARAAIRSYIMGDRECTAPEAKENEVTVEIPLAALRSIEAWVRAGVYKSVVDAIEDCVRDRFITERYKEGVEKRALEMMEETLEVVPDNKL